MKGFIKWINGGNKLFLFLVFLEVIKIIWFIVFDERSNMNKLLMLLKDFFLCLCCLENMKINLCWFYGIFKGIVG